MRQRDEYAVEMRIAAALDAEREREWEAAGRPHGDAGYSDLEEHDEQHDLGGF